MTIGCFVAGASGVAAGLWARNLTAWLVGALGAAALARTAGSKVEAAFLVAGPVGLGVSLLGAGQLGVRRWADVGPVHLNVAELLLPVVLVAAARRLPQHWSLIVMAVVLGLLAVQPDASQAAAFAAASIVGLAFTPQSVAVKGAWALTAVLAAVATALRPDPLAPVPEVEGILGLARSVSPIAASLAIATLAAAVLSPVLLGRLGAGRLPAWPLATYFAVAALAPAFGAYPVPLVGMGMSPIIGFWLGVGLLAAAGDAKVGSTDESAPAFAADAAQRSRRTP